jgi:hypothetical protein
VPRELTREQRAAVDALKAASTVEQEVATT